MEQGNKCYGLGDRPSAAERDAQKETRFETKRGAGPTANASEREMVGEAESGGERGPYGVFVSFSIHNKPLGAGRVTMSWRWWWVKVVVAGSGVFLGPLRSIVP